MPITIQCTACQKKLRVRDELAGKRIKCPCGQIVGVPAIQSESPVAPSNVAPAPIPMAQIADLTPVAPPRRVLWPWYAGGGAVLCGVAVAVIIIATSGGSDGPLTKEKIQGKWKGTFDNGTIEIDFKAQVAMVTIRTGGSLAIGSVGYEVDGSTSEVKLGEAVAKLKDGGLLLSGQFTFGLSIYRVPPTRLERETK